MARAPSLLAPLLSLGLGLRLVLSLPGAGAMDCGSFGRVERLSFAPEARVRWLAPRVREQGPLDPLYSTVRHFLSVVQLNPFPAGECTPFPGGLWEVCVPASTLVRLHLLCSYLSVGP